MQIRSIKLNSRSGCFTLRASVTKFAILGNICSPESLPRFRFWGVAPNPVSSEPEKSSFVFSSSDIRAPLLLVKLTVYAN
jgi:hypothetical protein